MQNYNNSGRQYPNCPMNNQNSYPNSQINYNGYGQYDNNSQYDQYGNNEQYSNNGQFGNNGYDQYGNNGYDQYANNGYDQYGNNEQYNNNGQFGNNGYDQYGNNGQYDDYDSYNYSGYNQKSPAGFIIFCIVIASLCITEFILFIAPGVLTKKRHDMLLKKAGIETTNSTTEATTSTTEATTVATTEATTVATTEATTAATTEATTAATTEATTEAVNLNTTELPSRSSFSWYMDSWHYNGIPADAVKITDYNLINGDWKMMYWWDADQVFDAYAEEYGNASLSWNGSSLSLTYKFGYITWSETESYDESDIPPDTYVGNDTEYGFEITSQTYGLSISGLEFYSWNGAQYAFGVTLSQSGDPGTVLLVRP